MTSFKGLEGDLLLEAQGLMPDLDLFEIKQTIDELDGLMSQQTHALENKVESIIKGGEEPEKGNDFDDTLGVEEFGVDGEYVSGTVGDESAGETTAIRVEGEVVYSNGEWLVDDIDEATKRWLEEEGELIASEDYTPEEEQTVQDFAREMYSEAQRRADAGNPQAGWSNQ